MNPESVNVGGDDAIASGLPTHDQLSPLHRAIVAASAAADHAARPVAATFLAAAVLPPLVSRSAARREHDNLAFYAELGAQHDPAVSFPRPTSRPRIHRKKANPIARAMATGTVESLSFQSPFEPLNPELRTMWQTLQRNNTAHAQHWRHDDEPRPTLCVIHGFCLSSYWLNGLALRLHRFYQAGYDLLLYTLPFHGARASRLSPYSGYGYFSHGFSGFSEAMAQAVHDFRIFVDYLESTGVTNIGVTGVSLGGYTSALLASVENRLKVVIPIVGVFDVPVLLDAWFPASTLLRAGFKCRRIDRALVDQTLAYSSALNYAPLVGNEGRLIITGLGDRLSSPQQSDKLWRHWDRCAMHWFPGNHIIQVGQSDFLCRMTQFLAESRFGSHEPQTPCAAR
jgi:Alpha/beta hydrolase domain containing 18